MSHFSKEFLTWLDTNADHIDQESGPIADQLLEKIAENNVFKIGVPAERFLCAWGQVFSLC